VRSKLGITILVAALELAFNAVGNYSSVQAQKKAVKWEYSVLRHSPNLRRGGDDLGKIQSMGAKGWELAASYRVKGEIIISVFKKPI